MGSGKSAVGKELARRLGMRLVELDNEIEKAEGVTIKEIFNEYGEPYFRDRETEMVKQFASEDNVVISTGGGVVMREENMNALRDKGIIVYLSAEPETVLERTKSSDERPLLNVVDPLQRIREILEFRKPYYEKADVVIATDIKTPLIIAEDVIQGIEEFEGS
jgi:shikimate kinase